MQKSKRLWAIVVDVANNKMLLPEPACVGTFPAFGKSRVPGGGHET